MDSSRWQHLQTLFHQAAVLAGPARERFIDEACAGDTELRVELLSLLDVGEDATRRLDASPDVASIVDALEPPDLVGERIGPYRLLEHLGHGGMGMVYLGERADGEFRQKVAIKLVRAPWLSSHTLTRFRAERQILARLEHPHIARLLDGGTTLQGQPYLVMEHVAGEPIDRYCAHRGLSTQQRLRLFQDVCAAVAYAHRQLVIHRDLKPSNILVTTDGVVKLLDFGIAKLVDSEGQPPVTDMPAATALHGGALTPEYASPEQVRGEPVTTASDVYALGILLYELLTGTALYRFTSTTLREVEKVVCETPVARPSTAVARTGRRPATETGGRVPLRSDITPEHLKRDLSGDLDTIVLTALHKEPDRRYHSAEQFADDIQRHLSGYPVKARPPSRRYRLMKFLQRNAWATASGIAVVLALVAGATAAWIGMLEAREQAALAESRRQDLEQVAHFQQSMLSDLDPQAMGGGIVGALRRQYREVVVSSVEPAGTEADLANFENAMVRVNATDLARNVIDEFVLARALATIERDFHDQPQLQADLYDSIYGVYRAIGLTAPLIEIGQRIATARDRSPATDSIDRLNARLRQADALLANGRMADAEADLHAILADAETAGLHRHETSWNARDLLAQAQIEQGKLDQARTLAESNRDLAHGLPDAPRLQLASLNTLGYIAARSQQNDKALEYFQQAAELLTDEQSPLYIRTNTNVAAALGSVGRIDEALAINQRLLDVALSHHGERHIQTLRIMNNVAANLMDLGRAEDAVPQLERIVALRAEVLGETDPLTLRSMLNLGSAYARTGRGEEGAALLRTVVQQRDAQLGPTHLDTLQAQEILASILNDVGHHAAALAVARSATAASTETYGKEHPRTVRLNHVLAATLNGNGLHAEAAAIAAQLLALHSAHPTGNDRALVESALFYYVALDRSGDRARAAEVRAAHLQPLLDADPAELDGWQRHVRERIDAALSLP